VDVFLLTCANGKVKRLSVEPHEMVSRPAISGDGTCIAYWSWNSDCRAEDCWKLRLIERTTGKSSSVEGLAPMFQGRSAPGSAPSISRDGSRLVFESYGPVRADGERQVVATLYDRQLDTTSIVSLGQDGSFDHGTVNSPAISANGQVVGFVAQSRGYAPWPLAAKTNILSSSQHSNVFVRNLEGGTTRAVNDLLAELEAQGNCTNPLLSADGSHVAFNHHDARFSENQKVAFVTGLVHDQPGRLLPLLEGGGKYQGEIKISWLAGDGKTVLVTTDGVGFLVRSRLTQPQVFLHALDNPDWTPISRSAEGQFANRPAIAAVASRDLSRIVFESDADNLVPEDTNNASDIFIVDRTTGKIARVEATH